jgi:hypothetical protein
MAKRQRPLTIAGKASEFPGPEAVDTTYRSRAARWNEYLNCLKRTL